MVPKSSVGVMSSETGRSRSQMSRLTGGLAPDNSAPAPDVKATKRPVDDTAGSNESVLVWFPLTPNETRSKTAVSKNPDAERATNTCAEPTCGAATMPITFGGEMTSAICVPSGVMSACLTSLSIGVFAVSVTSFVVFVWRSRTYTCVNGELTPVKSGEFDVNATKRPSADNVGSAFNPDAACPLAPTERSSRLHVTVTVPVHGGVHPITCCCTTRPTTTLTPTATKLPLSEMSRVSARWKLPAPSTLSVPVFESMRPTRADASMSVMPVYATKRPSADTASGPISEPPSTRKVGNDEPVIGTGVLFAVHRSQL